MYQAVERVTGLRVPVYCGVRRPGDPRVSGRCFTSGVAGVDAKIFRLGDDHHDDMAIAGPSNPPAPGRLAKSDRLLTDCRVPPSESNLSKYSIVRKRPSLSVVPGLQSSKAPAREMSGRRCLGSSSGKGRCTMRDWDPVRSIIFLAKSMIEN